ncbi:2-dehydro-3-deoxyphosphogalactonate aldolase [Xaviernesmea oryzae]|uniref:2-dehydro-3-deoxyphosphogalactonate aldolase n=1 Tax=Xaviernesmea oryzae TaxID=464029 RepID=A0A1X7GQ39_9HYPH|nr:2-dehydro-3-deoxy-6-phosphogalactonate aldolase [Xaviernesmea oryzae]SMF72293.1 2-dehydro-3-deoxyphosphogalactonate aldolase [Xaviernesmea oryzae]
MTFEEALKACNLVAILRGIKPEEAESVGEVLVEAGWRIIEVPLNSPEPLKSIEKLVKRFGEKALIGAGTVLTLAQVADVAATGAKVIISPNANPAVIKASRAAGMVSLPGVATPTEAFAAVEAGATGIKAFPAEAIPPIVIKAWKAVLPREIPVLAVGGVTPENMTAYAQAGAAGFGIGSSLYKPGADLASIAEKARKFIEAMRAA